MGWLGGWWEVHNGVGGLEVYNEVGGLEVHNGVGGRMESSQWGGWVGVHNGVVSCQARGFTLGGGLQRGNFLYTACRPSQRAEGPSFNDLTHVCNTPQYDHYCILMILGD
jgi:hypothetical protein